jgi:hypothetical protein
MFQTFIYKSKAYICTNKTFTHSFLRTVNKFSADNQGITNAREEIRKINNKINVHITDKADPVITKSALYYVFGILLSQQCYRDHFR